MSLRRRLVLSVAAIAAVGLVVLSAVSYFALRSYLSDRIDEQVDAAIEPARASLSRRAACGDFLDPPGEPPENVLPPEAAPPGLEPGGRGPVQLPPGTYAEVRDAAGSVVCSTDFAFGTQSGGGPDLPADTPISSELDPNVFEVPASGGGSAYRAAAIPVSDGGTLVVAVPLTEYERTLSRLLAIDAAVTAATLVAITLLGLWIVRVSLRPLDEMEEAARAIAAGDLDRRVANTDARTEVGRLGASFNEMVERLQDALDRREATEERLRRFLSDASHELRTPLSSIRGYAELFRLGAVSDPDELEQSLARIEGEATRMGRLVDELMLLARFDERRPASRAPVDLAVLAAEAVADARAANPDREISLSTEGPAVVDGDEGQLRQVVANLLTNATSHTPPGSEVEVAVTVEGATVRLVVRDHGPGLEPGTETAVFERFWRADKARERVRGGSGLGLAIVQAIVEAHGGSVVAAAAAGGGAEFTVTLAGGPPSEMAER